MLIYLLSLTASTDFSLTDAVFYLGLLVSQLAKR